MKTLPRLSRYSWKTAIFIFPGLISLILSELNAAAQDFTSATNSSVQFVQVKLGKKIKLAKGTTSWSYKATLKPGKNVFTVRVLASNALYFLPAKLTVIRN